MSAPPFRHFILDRDGVLNVEAADGDWVRDPSQFHWLPGALEALALLKRSGARVSVVTNQSGVGRGLMSLAQLAAVHQRMQKEAAARGGAPDAVFFCPHAPDDRCSCRKPAPGLIREAMERSGVAAAETLVVGDDGRDLEAARQAGVAAALVRTGKGRQTESLLGANNGDVPAVPVYDDLLGLARTLIASRTAAAAAGSRDVGSIS